MFASMCNHPHVVNELLSSGASLTLSNINGHSALALAVKHVSYEVVKFSTIFQTAMIGFRTDCSGLRSFVDVRAI